MKTVTVSSRYKITIPLECRSLLNIQPGQKLVVQMHGTHIVLLPQQAMSDARGFLAGIDTQIKRNNDRV